MVVSICSGVRSSQGVVMMRAFSLCSRSSSTHFAILSSVVVWVRLKMMVSADSIWSMKNSPKLRAYILHLPTSATVAHPASSISWVLATSSTTRRMSESLPTPEGSIRMRSGWYWSINWPRASVKSPTSVQQMQPLLSSVIWTPVSFMNPPSMPTSPYSFSSSTTFSPSKAPSSSFLISVVLPAPRKPEMILTFVILLSPVFVSFSPCGVADISPQKGHILPLA